MQIEKESLLKQFFTNIQHLTFTISTNFKILDISKKGEVSTLNGAKLINFNGFFWRIDTLSVRQLVRPQATQA